MSSSAQVTSSGEKVSIRDSSSASDGRSASARGRISMAPFEGDLDQPGGQRLVGDPRLRGGAGEPGLRVEIAVGVHVNNVRVAVRTQSQVHPPIIPALERVEGGGGHG